MFSQIEFEDELERAIREYLERAKRPIQAEPEEPDGEKLEKLIYQCLNDLRDSGDSR